MDTGQSLSTSPPFLCSYFYYRHVGRVYWNCSRLVGPSVNGVLGCQMGFVQDVLIVRTAVVFHPNSCHVEVAKSTRVRVCLLEFSKACHLCQRPQTKVKNVTLWAVDYPNVLLPCVAKAVHCLSLGVALVVQQRLARYSVFISHPMVEVALQHILSYAIFISHKLTIKATQSCISIH